MLFSTGNNVIDIDVMQTKELYFSSLYVWQRCHCPVCRNFDESLQKLEGKELRFLEEMGISPAKCFDLWPYEPGEKSGYQKYVLTYPVVCKVVKYNGDAEEWFAIKNGLSASIVINEGLTFLKLDWELKWMHR